VQDGPRERARDPFVVAHRAGNELAVLRRAEALRIPLVELDVHLHRGRLEVRHLKTLGPVPVLWDRWRLAPGWTPRLTLGELHGEAAPQTELMLDLKGGDRRLAHLVVDELAARDSDAPVTVCSRHWLQLEPIETLAGVRTVHSVGSRRQLATLRTRFAGRRLAGVSIHRRLLDPATAAELRERAGLVLCWPVATAADARLLGTWGVDGVISERFEMLSAALRTGVPA
jgi:glycerophosphoryl diester phosphodiesterase